MNIIRLNTKFISTMGSILMMPASEMIAAANIATSTWYCIMQKPDEITVQHILALANGLHIPVRRFFSTGRTDIIGRREDYISASYQPCRYDAGTLQRLINSHSGVTWQKAAETVGMTPSRLRNSLLGETRTPVIRFLSVCAVFDIDPFSILIDPNPEPRKSGRHTARHTTANEEIAAIREEVSSLRKQIADLTSKYSDLLKAHERLAKRVSVNIENINSSYIGIAADHTPMD